MIVNTEFNGRGVIATDKIPRNTLISLYFGDICFRSEFTKGNNLIVTLGYVGSREIVVIPKNTQNIGIILIILGRFFNHSSRAKANMELRKCASKYHGEAEVMLYFITTRQIKKNEELLWYYGDYYW